MTKQIRRTFSPEFRLESAQLVVDQGYTVRKACEAMNVSKSAMIMGTPTEARTQRSSYN